MTRVIPRILALLAMTVAALTIAACGSSERPASGKSDEEKQLAFQDCLRDQGLDVHVDDNGGVAVRMTSRGGGRGTSNVGGPDDRAFKTCRKRTGWAPRPPTEAQQAEMRDRALTFARCMRAHGVDVADPAADGRMMIRIRGDSPTAEAAQRACGGPEGPASAGQTKP